jgi:hypothetical protein
MQVRLADTSFEADCADRFSRATPLPHVVFDDFLPATFADGLWEEIQVSKDFRRSSDYIFAKNKYESPSIETLGPFGSAIRGLLVSAEFAGALSGVCGKAVFVDPDFVGGGLHRGGEGSFLDMHTDFERHPGNARWVRELNLLLYLNRGWLPEFGGCLDLRNSRSDATGAIEPKFNRLVIMLTKDFTFHGYRPISFPRGSYRISIAAYAYSIAGSGVELSRLKTTTTWRPESRSVVKRACAWLTPELVTLKQRLFGSATAGGRRHPKE